MIQIPFHVRRFYQKKSRHFSFRIFSRPHTHGTLHMGLCTRHTITVWSISAWLVYVPAPPRQKNANSEAVFGPFKQSAHFFIIKISCKSRAWKHCDDEIFVVLVWMCVMWKSVLGARFRNDAVDSHCCCLCPCWRWRCRVCFMSFYDDYHLFLCFCERR
jgi:hypothetical protein